MFIEKNKNGKKLDRECFSIINAHLQDDTSKKIFSNRVLYSLTNDGCYMRNVCETVNSYLHLQERLRENDDKEKVLFGLGRWGEWIVETYDINWDYCCDNYRKNMSAFHDIPFISIDELSNGHKDAFIVVSVKYNYNEIVKQLR